MIGILLIFALPVVLTAIVDDPVVSTTGVAEYKRRVEFDSTDIVALKKLGEYYKKSHAYTEAINWLERGLAIAPSDTGLLFGLGEAYYLNGDYAPALATFTRLIERAPTVDAYFNLGAVLIKGKRYGEAVKAFKSALALKPDDVEILFHLAGVYLVIGEYRSAIDTYKKIIGLVPDDPRAYEGRASAYWKLGENELSKNDINHAKELRSSFKPTFSELAEVKSQKKEVSTTVKEEEAAGIYTRDPEILFYVGEIHQITGEWELAVKTYTAAIKLAPRNPKYYKERARCYKELGKFEESETDLQKMKELQR